MQSLIRWNVQRFLFSTSWILESAHIPTSGFPPFGNCAGITISRVGRWSQLLPSSVGLAWRKPGLGPEPGPEAVSRIPLLPHLRGRIQPSWPHTWNPSSWQGDFRPAKPSPPPRHWPWSGGATLRRRVPPCEPWSRRGCWSDLGDVGKRVVLDRDACPNEPPS